MENWILKAVHSWESSNTQMNPPALISEIEKAEVALNFKFPEDFKQLYQVVNGFPNLAWQEHMFCFWPLEMIIEESERWTDKKFIGFCDFLLASHTIGFVRNKKGIYKDYDHINQIADTYQEAVNMINSSADDIY
jgi:hypothetical protein